MAAKMTRHPSIAPMHPGELLREDVIPATGLPKSKIATMMGVSRQTLFDILGQRQPVTPQIAVRLGKLFGNGPAFWARLQAAYDVWHAERAIDVSTVPTIAAMTI